MNELKYFFRGQFDGYVFKLFTPIHFLILGIMILGILLIVLNKKYLKTEDGRKFKKLIFAILLIEQISQYAWYFLAGTFTLGDGLPLYICRTAIISILIALATGKYKVESISVYWGLFGGVLASIVPVIYAFEFPHFTNFTYFIGHLFMVWSVTWFLAVEDYQFTKSGLISTLVFTNVFNVFVNWLNPLVNGNYSYFTFSPVLPDFFGSLDHRFYDLIVFMIYNLLILLIHFIGSKLQSKGEGLKAAVKN